MGRSRAVFFIPNVTAGAVLHAAAAFAPRIKHRAHPVAAPNQFAMTRGSEHISGKHQIVVTAWDIPGGANVQIEAWVDASMDVWSADPAALIGIFPRRKLWKNVGKLCEAIGAPGATASFVHT